LTEFDKETEDLINCALAYRKLGSGEPLYFNRQELMKQWVKYAAHTEQAEHQDVFRKLPYELAIDMSPLNRKVYPNE
jgi:hypothetical protein